MDKFPIEEGNERLIDVSQRPDMSEIIAASDVCLTDYSTVIFESFLTRNPGFIYVDDLNEYIADRGILMFKKEEIPFSVACNNDELVENILNFEQEIYEKKVDEFIEKTGIMEDGHASERVVELIERLASFSNENRKYQVDFKAGKRMRS